MNKSAVISLAGVLALASGSFAFVACSRASEADAVLECASKTNVRGFNAVESWWDQGERHTTWVGDAALDPVSLVDGYAFHRLQIAGPRYDTIAQGSAGECIASIERLKPGKQPNGDSIDAETMQKVQAGELQLLEVAVNRRRK